MRNLGGDRWSELARAPVEAGLARARARYGELDVSADELREATVARTLARFERAGVEAEERAFRDALARAALDELALALAWQRGDERAWVLYANELRPAVAAAARRQGAGEAAAEELADELPGALLAADAEGRAAPLARYDGSGSLRAWLCTIARRRVADAAVRGARDVALEERGLPAGAADPADSAARGERAARLERAARELRAELTPRERLALLLKLEQGLPQRAIAARLGVSDSRVTRLVQHAGEKLRARLAPALAGEPLERGELEAALTHALGSAETQGQVPAPPTDVPGRRETP